MNPETRDVRHPAPPRHRAASAPRTFSVQLSSTRRGARLARLLTTQQLAEWGVPYGSGVSQDAAAIAAELGSNAVCHCGGTGRDFRLRVVLHPAPGLLRIEVTDARADRPLPHGLPESAADAESGRGLLLVDALARRWGSRVNDLITKTVWAELTFSVVATTTGAER
jgi:hypothetical protein